MIATIRHYLVTLTQRFGAAWNLFWFMPSDPYTLCAMRLLTGLVAVYQHLTLSFDLESFFARGGWLPVETVRKLGGEFDGLSYLNYLSTPAELWMAHLVGLVVLALFTIGLLTRVSAVLAVVVVLSDINRAPMLTSQLEPVLTMVMIYLCLAPVGRYLSIDRLLAHRKAVAIGPAALAALEENPPSTAATIATRLIQVHLAMLFLMMGTSKLGGNVWWHGTAAWWLMARSESRLIDLTALRNYPRLIDAWTHAVVLFELSFPILIWHPLARPLLLAIAVVMWGSLALLTGHVAFSVMMLVASLAFVPPEILRACVAACCGRDKKVSVSP